MLALCGCDLAKAPPRPDAAVDDARSFPPPPGLDDRDEIGLESALDVFGEEPELPEKDRRVDGGRSLLGFATAPADRLRATAPLAEMNEKKNIHDYKAFFNNNPRS